MKGELPPWFMFRPAVVFSSPFFQAAVGDGDLARAFLQVMAWNWSKGAGEFDRDKFSLMLAGGDATMARLELYGVVRATADGRVVVSIDWMDEARSYALERQKEQSRAGTLSASARSRSRPGTQRNAGSTPAERPINARSTRVQPEEERREEKSSVPPPGAPGSWDESATGTGARAPGQRTRPQERQKRVAETWESVLARPEYERLRRHAEFMAAWSQWIDWCRTRGAKARLPVGVQAARMLNRAIQDPVRYARAIALSIERNYAAVDPAWLRPPPGDERVSFIPKAELAAARAIALSRAARTQNQKGTP